MIPQKFIEFIEEIVAGDDYEYGDGSSMTEDAKIALAEIQRWRNLVTPTEGYTKAVARFEEQRARVEKKLRGEGTNDARQ